MSREPKQARARATYEKLLRAAGLLLEERGVENLSTNAIVERADLTPPAFYRYFTDKYEILSVLGHRLMQGQNTLIISLLEDIDDNDAFSLCVAELEGLISETIRVTEEFPGGPWIMRSLRAVPRLQAIRTDSHHEMATAIADGAAELFPEIKRSVIYQQGRLALDVGYAAMELIFDEPSLDRDAICHDAAKAIGAFYKIVT